MYSYYLSEVIDTKFRAQTVAAIRDLIEKRNINFTHFAVRGLSGMLVAPELASLMGKQVMIVRKRVTNHSEFRIEFSGHVKGYIIVDDLVWTGSTVKRIKKYVDECKKEIQNIPLQHAELRAVVCYHTDWDNNPETICNVPVLCL